MDKISESQLKEQSTIERLKNEVNRLHTVLEEVECQVESEYLSRYANEQIKISNSIMMDILHGTTDEMLRKFKEEYKQIG